MFAQATEFLSTIFEPISDDHPWLQRRSKTSRAGPRQTFSRNSISPRLFLAASRALLAASWVNSNQLKGVVHLEKNMWTCSRNLGEMDRNAASNWQSMTIWEIFGGEPQNVCWFWGTKMSKLLRHEKSTHQKTVARDSWSWPVPASSCSASLSTQQPQSLEVKWAQVPLDSLEIGYSYSPKCQC